VGLVVEGAVARGEWRCFTLPSFVARTGFFCFGGVLAMDFDFAAVEFLRARPDLFDDMAFAVAVERAVEADGSLQVGIDSFLPSFFPLLPFLSFPLTHSELIFICA
jgi:hypothetical protein